MIMSCPLCDEKSSFKLLTPKFHNHTELEIKLQHDSKETLLLLGLFDRVNKRRIHYESPIGANYCFNCGEKL